MKLMLHGTAAIVFTLLAVPTEGATREETLRRFDTVHATREDTTRLEAWLNAERGGAGDRSRNALALGDVERLRIVASEDAHVLVFRVDAFGDVRPFPEDLPTEIPLKAKVETAIPQEGTEALRRPPMGDEDIYVFATKERIDPESLSADFRSVSLNDESPGPKIADRIAKRMNALPAGSVTASVVRLRVTPRRSEGTRGLAIEGDYTAEDIANYYAPTRGIMPRLFPGLIHFATSQASLTAKGKANLEAWASALTSKLAGASFAIEGHTDDTGTDEKNAIVSKLRAETVRDFLVEHGVETSRLVAESHGKKGAIREGVSEEARQANRRVDFRIVRMN